MTPVLSKQFDTILDSYIAAGLVQHDPWSSPLVWVPTISGSIRIIVNYQKLNNITEILQIEFPRVDEVLDTLGSDSVVSVFDLSSGFTQFKIHPDDKTLIASCTLTGLYEAPLVLPPDSFRS